MRRRSHAPTHDSSRRLFLISSTVGALAAVILFVLIMQGARGGLLNRDLLGNFYDGQARAILDGHLNVDPSIPGFEGFRIGNETHIYQGLTPVLLRLPLLAVTDAFDGRLTGISMILGFMVTMTYVVAASARIRTLTRGEAKVSRSEAVLTAVATFGIGGGSVLFLASRAWVYHEAAVWGVALTLGSLTHLVYWSSIRGDTNSRRFPHLFASVLLAALAINTRSSIGLGPLAALGLTATAIAYWLLTKARRDHSNSTERPGRLVSLTGWQPRTTHSAVTALVTIIVGVALGVGLYSSVNYARFGSLVSVPLDRQLLVTNDVQRQRSLAANGNSLFGLQYAPSVLLQVLRPDAVSLRSQFPYLAFPQERPKVLGDAVFAERDWSSSLSTSEPLLLLAGIFGVLIAIFPRWSRPRPRDPDGSPELVANDQASPASMRIPLLGAAIGCGAILVFGYIAERYLSDFYPFLVLSALLGLHGLGERLSAGESHLKRIVFASLIVATTAWGVWANTSLALQYQREIAPGFSDVGRDRWLQLQLDLPGRFEPIRVDDTTTLPAKAPVGQLAIVGDCQALYRSSGDVWYLIETGVEAGGHTIAVVSTTSLPGPITLADASTPNGSAKLVLQPISGGRARLALPIRVESDVDQSDTTESAQDMLHGPEFDLNADSDGGFELNLHTVYDSLSGELIVTLGSGSSEVFRHQVDLTTALVAVDQQPGVSVRVDGLPTPLCDRLNARG